MQSKITQLSVLGAALVMAFVICSGFSHVNVFHHMDLLGDSKDVDAFVSKTESHPNLNGNFRTVTDVRLPTEIDNIANYNNILRLLQEAEPGDEIRIHISGYGGDFESALSLINNLHATKAHTIMIVESMAFSAHAYIAVSGDELIMEPYSFLMFHTVSSYGTDCNQETGTDRTVSNVEHCKVLEDNIIYLANKFLDSITLLTSEEKVLVKLGHDVYITSDTYEARKSNPNYTPNSPTLGNTETTSFIVSK